MARTIKEGGRTYVKVPSRSGEPRDVYVREDLVDYPDANRYTREVGGRRLRTFHDVKQGIHSNYQSPAERRGLDFIDDLNRRARRAESRADERWEHQKERDAYYDEVAREARAAAEEDRRYRREYLEEQRERERKRQADADLQRKKSISILETSRARRNELIKDIEDAPSSAMQQAKQNYDRQAQNMAASAGHTGTATGRGLAREYSDSMRVGDANLMNMTAVARIGENLARKSATSSLLNQNAQNAMQQYALSTGEGNSFLPALNASSAGISNLLGLGAQSLASAGQAGSQALGLGGLANQSAGIGLSGVSAMMQNMNQRRLYNLEREKFDFQKVMAPWNFIASLGGSLLGSGLFGGVGKDK